MQTFFIFSLFIFWTLFGSFASVLIYRLHSKESWILTWRSHCPKCNHKLNFWDLIPIFSWLKNLWKCKYCNEKISPIYLFLELSTWILFSLIWYFLIDYNLIFSLNLNEIIKLIFWLSIWFITILYTFYDIIFLEIHEWIMLTWIIIILFAIIFQSLSLINIIPSLATSWNIISIFTLIFWVIWFYYIMLKEKNEIIDLIILFLIWLSIYYTKNFLQIEIKNDTSLSALYWALLIFWFFYIQYLIWIILHYFEKKDKNKKEEDYRFSEWIIWWWDFRIAIFVWTLLWYSYSIAWLFLTYIVWTIISILIILIQNILKKETNSTVPFWPFLAIWFFITIFYLKEINYFITIYFSNL